MRLLRENYRSGNRPFGRTLHRATGFSDFDTAHEPPNVSSDFNLSGVWVWAIFAAGDVHSSVEGECVMAEVLIAKPVLESLRAIRTGEIVMSKSDFGIGTQPTAKRPVHTAPSE